MRTYRTREERLTFLQKQFAPFLQGRILDVGCDKAYLRQHIDQARYVGIDLYGDPDVFVDLEESVLPFANNAFKCVLCLDVLEHLEHIHAISGELIRVTSQYVIVSLPNPFAQYWPLFFRGGGNADKYGLPVDPPSDRHRWFFNYEEAKTFLTTMARRNHAQILQILPVPLAESSVFWKAIIKELLRRSMGPRGDQYLNFGAQAIWVVMEKQHADRT